MGKAALQALSLLTIAMLIVATASPMILASRAGETQVESEAAQAKLLGPLRVFSASLPSWRATAASPTG